MLELIVMRIFLLILLTLSQSIGWFSPPPQLDLARIVSPKSGEVLQGNIEIKGTVTGIGFQYAEINFQSTSSSQNTWFLITKINEVIVDDVLTIWDTTNIADGTYSLRVVAFYEDGHIVESTVENLRIRNYTAIETIEPNPLEDLDPISNPTIVSVTATENRPTPTNLPPNDLALDKKDFISVAILGGLLGGTSLIVVGFLLLIRKRRHG